ncbi:hypothetical protein RF11_11953 [Thelohanellus kitauei]|uniref:Uncharacterized protein n=1 Tax=Thelohanellus kitauei TaxID=669202 RepID=A0A0C2MG57_THEKT|nr:hypothetical protein RF11_11953 [Thelohanellus kitauei]
MSYMASTQRCGLFWLHSDVCYAFREQCIADSSICTIIPGPPSVKFSVENVQLSDGTATRRIQNILKDLKIQLKRDLDKCEWFSLQFYDSKDIIDTAQLAVMLSASDELLKLLPMKGRTMGGEIMY